MKKKIVSALFLKHQIMDFINFKSIEIDCIIYVI